MQDEVDEVDVVVVGGGPVGLLLAGDLATGGARVVVLERESAPADLPVKQGEMGARALNAPSVHVLAARGLLPAVKRDALMWWSSDDPPPPRRPGVADDGDEPPVFAGHFAGIMLRADRIDFDDPAFAGDGDGGGVIAQGDLERILAARARDRGVRIRTGTSVLGVEQDGGGVTATTTQGPVRASWLVGCDGGRSTVRKLAGIEFPGDDAEIFCRLALVDMTEPEALLPGGLHQCDGGSYLLGGWQMRLRPTRITTIEPLPFTTDRDDPVTADEVQDSIHRVSGIRTTITAVHAATRYADTTRQAATYRAGRILLAGDAAHVHSPAGGQGLNLGIGDAVNLGWKLAAVITNRADPDLLDTYTAERHPTGAWVQEWTKAQSALERRDSRTQALRSILTDLLDTTAGATYVLKKIAGVDLHYDLTGDLPGDLPGEHPLTGRLAPWPVDGDDGRFTLVAPDTATSLRALAAGFDAIRVVEPPDDTTPAALVRPDGIVCWAADQNHAPEELPESWKRWLPARHPASTSSG